MTYDIQELADRSLEKGLEETISHSIDAVPKSILVDLANGILEGDDSRVVRQLSFIIEKLSLESGELTANENFKAQKAARELQNHIIAYNLAKGVITD
jgi:hypothetical protein